MRLRILVILSSLLLAGTAAADAPPHLPKSASPSAELYASLVARAEAGDANVDYTALRLSYTQTEKYDPYNGGTEQLLGDSQHAMDAKDCSTALAKLGQLLHLDYTSILAHAMRSDCFGQTGDKAGAARELVVARGLAASLYSSGDGESLSSAYVVVTMYEEGFILRGMGLVERRQALLQQDGHAFDEIEASGKTGETKTVYFDVTNLLSGLSREFGSPH